MKYLKLYELYLLEHGKSSGTIKSYVSSVKSFGNWLSGAGLEELELSYDEVLAYVSTCREKAHRPSTLERRVFCMRRYYEMLEAQGFIDVNPFSGLKLRKGQERLLEKRLKMEALESWYESYPDGTLVGKRNKCMYGMLVYQGLRVMDLKRLRLGDVNLRKGEVWIRGSLVSNERTMALCACQLLDLQTYELRVRPALLLGKGEATDLYYVSSGSSGSLKNGVQHLVKGLKKEHGELKNLEQIRSSVIRHWLSRYNLREVQYLAGHKYVSSTERYSEKGFATLVEQLSKKHPLRD